VPLCVAVAAAANCPYAGCEISKGASALVCAISEALQESNIAEVVSMLRFA
jgi:hypothetical protein